MFFDFLPLNAVVIKGFVTKFQLYTVPGQVIYNATRQLVLRSVDGIVFVADSQWEKMEENVESFKNLEDNLAKQNISIDEIPYVLQYNKRDLPNIAPVNYLEYVLNNRKRRVQSFEVISSTGQNVFASLNAVSQILLHKFSKQSDVPKTAPAPVAIPVEPPPSRRSKAHPYERHSCLTIENVATLDGVLGDFLKKAEAELTVVIDRGGNVISQFGDMSMMDVTIIAALAAGSFAATQGTGAPHRRGGIQRALSPGQRQSHFHELGRRRHDHDHGFRDAHDGWSGSILFRRHGAKCRRAFEVAARQHARICFYRDDIGDAEIFSRPRSRRKHVLARELSSVFSRRKYSVNSFATSVALWPPKPKELLSATRTFFSRATFGV